MKLVPYLYGMNNEKALNWLYNNHPEFSWDMVDFTLEDKTGVYCIYDAAMGLAYFGKSAKVRHRVNLHKSVFLRGAHYNPYMQASYSGGSDFKYFYVRYTANLDAAEFLEAHLAAVFGPDKVHNRLSISCPSLHRSSSKEYWDLHEALGYEGDKKQMFISTSWFNRKGYVPDYMKKALELSRKLIL